jgi:regulatory protein
LEKRDYPEAQLRTKLLAGGYPESVVEDTIGYLKGYRYLDDARFARQFIQFRMEQLSRRQIVTKLAAKGISKDTVEAVYDELEALGEYAPDMQEEQLARQQLEKKLRNVDVSGMQRSDWNKVYQFLARKGFSASVIMQVIKNYQSEHAPF